MGAGAGEQQILVGLQVSSVVGVGVQDEAGQGMVRYPALVLGGPKTGLALKPVAL
jgi:hypothetical protein